MMQFEDIVAQYPPKAQYPPRFMLREYLQCKILDIIFSSAYSSKLVFIGGTCLRLLHQNQRFSEDIDFDHFGMTDADFDSIAVLLEKELSLQGFRVEMRQVHKTAWHCYLKFPDLLFQNNISGHKEEKILIQVDAEAQGFDFKPEAKLLQAFDVFTNILIPPLSLLLSHKVAAILCRPRNKGRDFFDLTFLQAKAKPDYGFLSLKLDINNPQELKDRLLGHCAKLDFNEMAEDVAPFLFNARDKNRVLLFPEFVAQADW